MRWNSGKSELLHANDFGILLLTIFVRQSNRSIGSILAEQERQAQEEESGSLYGPASVMGGSAGYTPQGYFHGMPSQENFFAGPFDSNPNPESASTYGYNPFGTPRVSTDQLSRVESQQPLLSHIPPSPAAGQLPSEERLIWDIQQIVSISDLNVVTKKSIRQEL